jgi:BlaI family penicillinase repressor
MKTPHITEAEWAVMKVLWSENPLTGNAVAERLSATHHWKPKTVKTLLTRLVNKDVLDYDKQGREFHYYPLVKERACVKDASRTFLRRVFDGAVQPMLATILESERLSDKEIQELKALLEEKGRA